MEKIYQFKLGKPFIVNEVEQDIHSLFYSCDYIETKSSFLMEKEKFINLLEKGLITEYKNVINL